MIKKPTNTNKYIKISDIINIVFLPHYFVHTYSHPQGVVLQKMEVTRYYKVYALYTPEMHIGAWVHKRL